MHWKSTKCSIICSSQSEIEEERIRLSIEGKELKKARESTYMCVTLTTKGLSVRKTVKIGKQMLKKIPSLVNYINMNMAAPQNRVKYVLETY